MMSKIVCHDCHREIKPIDAQRVIRPGMREPAWVCGDQFACEIPAPPQYKPPAPVSMGPLIRKRGGVARGETGKGVKL